MNRSPERASVRIWVLMADLLCQLGGDGEAELLDRHASRAPEPGQREGPGVEHRLELRVGGHRYALGEALLAELPLGGRQCGAALDLVEHQRRVLEPKVAERELDFRVGDPL